jgi:hypothetical protein
MKMEDIVKMILFLILAMLTLTFKEQSLLVSIGRFICLFFVGWYLGGIFRIRKEEK